MQFRFLYILYVCSTPAASWFYGARTLLYLLFFFRLQGFSFLLSLIQSFSDGFWLYSVWISVKTTQPSEIHAKRQNNISLGSLNVIKKLQRNKSPNIDTKVQASDAPVRHTNTHIHTWSAYFTKAINACLTDACQRQIKSVRINYWAMRLYAENINYSRH